MNEAPQALVAADFITKIVEGETGIVDMIEAQLGAYQVLLFDCALCEGLERASTPTAEGLKALARLLRISQFVPTGPSR